MYVFLPSLYQHAGLTRVGLPSPLALGAVRPAKRNRDPNHIPKPSNAFMCFRGEFNEILKAKKEAAGDEQQDGTAENKQRDGTTENKQQKDVSKDAGEVWNSMTPEEQAPYYRMAAKLKKEHMLKYGKQNSAGKRKKKDTTTPKKGRKACAADVSATVLALPSAGSSLQPGYDVPTSSMVATSSYAVPVPVSTTPFGNEHNWCSPFAPAETLMPTPALTPCPTLSPSPGPSLYSFPPSASASRVASPAVLDFTADGTFYSDLPPFPHANMAPFTGHGDYLAVPGYQLYDNQLPFNGCAPLVPNHLDHVSYPVPLAESDGAFDYQFCEQSIPMPPSTWYDPGLATAETEYTWPREPVDHTTFTPAENVAVNQEALQQMGPQDPVCPETSMPHSLDWWIARLDPLYTSDDAVAS